MAIANSHLVMGHGEQALAALERMVAQEGVGGGQSLFEGFWQGVGLISLGQYESALLLCEGMLGSPQGDAVAVLRPVLAHLLLTQMALYRGWADEAIAQCNLVLEAPMQMTAPLFALLGAMAYRCRSRVYVALGQFEAALKDCDMALQLHFEASMAALKLMVRALACLQAGDLALADRLSAASLRQLPDSLELQCLRADVLLSLGRFDERSLLLQAVATGYPHEHWGRIAAAALESTAA
jgi:tetratricopeptide (TPR) repeat protein